MPHHGGDATSGAPNATALTLSPAMPDIVGCRNDFVKYLQAKRCCQQLATVIRFPGMSTSTTTTTSTAPSTAASTAGSPGTRRPRLTRKEWTGLGGMGGFIALLHVVGWGILAIFVVPAHYHVATGLFGVGTGLTAYT